jgi:signal transduction histidine kinase
MTRSRYVAAGLWLLIVALTLVTLLGIVLVDWRVVRPDLRPDSSDTASALPILAFATVGMLIAWSQPRNRIGWLLMFTAICATFLSLPKMYAGFAIDLHHGWLPAPLWIFQLSQVAWVFTFSCFLMLLPLFYPDGRLPSARWRIVLWLIGVNAIVGILIALDPRAHPQGLYNPLAVAALNGFYTAIEFPFVLVFLGTALACIASLVPRYRRGDARERQQLKLLMAAAALVFILFVASIFLPFAQNGLLVPIAVTALPIAIGIAILRYQLYDIEFIINKALVYGGLALLITALYVLVVVGFGALVGTRTQFLLSLLATAVIALAFQPLRQRAQRLANRLVYGKRATPYEALSQFSEHLSETFSDEDILDRMSRILAQGTGAERAEVWVRAGPRLLLASASPVDDGAGPRELAMDNGTLPVLRRDRLAPVSHQGELLGALAVTKKRGEAINAVEDKLVTDLAGQAGLVLKNVGLNRELLARLEDLRSSRQRLVTAQDEERRRIERNLHDGAQQHLIALKMKVGVAEKLSEPSSKARPILAQLKRDADEAIDNLRELARGIYPPLLASDGLAAALSASARRLTIPVDLKVEEVPRQPREVEAAIYFCCLEALQNVAKYADATHVELRVWKDDSRLQFTVHDDGKGFDPLARMGTSGLQNMRDRVEALGGSVQVESAPGRGTTVEGRLPITK